MYKLRGVYNGQGVILSLLSNDWEFGSYQYKGKEYNNFQGIEKMLTHNLYNGKRGQTAFKLPLIKILQINRRL